MAETTQKSANGRTSFLAVFIKGNDTAEIGKSGHRIIGIGLFEDRMIGDLISMD